MSDLIAPVQLLQEPPDQTAVNNRLIELLTDIRAELRILNYQFQSAFAITDDIDMYRNDPYFTNDIT